MPVMLLVSSSDSALNLHSAEIHCFYNSDYNPLVYRWFMSATNSLFQIKTVENCLEFMMQN